MNSAPVFYIRLLLTALLVSLHPLTSVAIELHPALEQPKPNAATLRHTQTGDVIGFTGPHRTLAWLGIPFAKPPVGALRWRAPLPPTPWQGVRKAVEYGSSCLQSEGEGAQNLHGKFITLDEYRKTVTYTGSEDCLFLNIRSPRTTSGAGKGQPVMVWIHGGANITGSGAFDTSTLTAKENVVTVTINYRLGLFGYFTHDALRTGAGSAEDRSGNYGLLDQMRALQWVRANIAAFGGDPRNITIFGDSAGALDCLGLLVSPKAVGLFDRVIAMSGGTWTSSVDEVSRYTDDPSPGLTDSSAEILLRLLIRDGQATNRAGAKVVAAAMTPGAITDYLRAKTFADLDFALAAATADKPSSGGAPLIRDGAVIPQEGIAAALAKRDGYNRVPVLIGTTRDEDQPYVIADSRFVEQDAGPHGVEYRFKSISAFRMAVEYMSLSWNADGAQERAASLSAHQPGEIFAYQTAWDQWLPWPGPDREPRGAGHGSDVAFIFGFPAQTTLGDARWGGGVPAAAVPSYTAMSNAVMSYWAAFAASGNPGKGRHGELPEWKPWSNAAGAPKYLILDAPSRGGLRMSTAYTTKAGYLDKLAHDDRLPAQQSKCEFLATLVSFSSTVGRVITPADYNGFAGGACKKIH